MMEKAKEKNISKKYNVYTIRSKTCYDGVAFVAAETYIKANEIVDDEIKNDTMNRCDRWGWGYTTDDDIIENLFSDKEGVIYTNIHYVGQM